MSKIQAYIDQRDADSQQFWGKLLRSPSQPISREEMLQQARAGAATPTPPLPPRDLLAEQAELRDLAKYLPWLRLRQAESLGIALETLKGYFAPPESKKFRPLRSEQDADALWAVLRDTAHYIQISLPDRFKTMPELPK